MLKVSSLSFAFTHRKLFHQVDFQLDRRDIMHLQGPNGVGKSTLLTVLAGLRAPTAGKVECFDRAGQMLTDQRIFFAYLSAEANGLYLKMDAKDNLRFWCRLRGLELSDTKIFQTLDHWGLGHRLLRQAFPVGNFSTGMRRRLALARMSLSQAPCWLLDEPIYGLDEKGITLFQELLASHQAEGGMALVVSHDCQPLKPLLTKSYELSP